MSLRHILILFPLLLILPIVLLLYYIITSLWQEGYTLIAFNSSALIHSIILSGISSFLSVLLGVFLATIFYTFHSYISRIFYLLLLFTFFILQPVILLSIYQSIPFFLHLEIFTQTLFISTLHLTPLASIIWIYIFSKLNHNALHIALDISSLKYTLKHIIFPQIYSFIILLFIFLFILVFIDQEVPSILGFRTYTEDLLAQITLMEDMSHIIHTAFPSILLVLLLSGILKYTIPQISHLSYQSTKQKIMINTYYIPVNSFILLISLCYLIFILYLLIHHVTQDSCLLLLEENYLLILKSILFSFITAVLTLGIALCILNILNHIKLIWVTYIFYITLLFYLLLPHALISLILLNIYQWIGIFSTENDYLVFLLGYIFVLLPIAFLLLYLFKSKKKEDYFFTFFKIKSHQKWLRIIFPSHILQWTIILSILTLFSLNELSTSILLIPPGFETMIVKIYNLLHYGDKSTIAFLSLMQLFFVILSLLFLFWAFKRWHHD